MTSSAPTIIGISGSLRKGSYNSALLRAATELAPPSVKLQIATIQGIPLYDGDLEAESGIPAPVRELKDLVANSAGLLLVTPEYNNSIPGVLKNAIDWLSRPPADIPRVFGELPVGVLGATPGRFGTVLAQTAWLPVLRTLGTEPYFGPRVLVASASKAFDASGRLVDETLRGLLKEFMTGFAEFVTREVR